MFCNMVVGGECERMKHRKAILTIDNPNHNVNNYYILPASYWHFAKCFSPVITFKAQNSLKYVLLFLFYS